MKILSPEEIQFERTNDGINMICCDGKLYQKIHFILLFPFTDTENYISVVLQKDKNYEEIGIIKHLKDLALSYQVIINERINFKYFIPEIKDVKKIIHKHGVFEFYVNTDRGEKVFYLRNIRENINIKGNNSIIFTDIEKCRYKISDFDGLSFKAKVELDRVLL